MNSKKCCLKNYKKDNFSIINRKKLYKRISKNQNKKNYNNKKIKYNPQSMARCQKNMK